MKVKKYLNVRKALQYFIMKTAELWPDRLYLSLLYRLRFSRKLNWNNPTSFNEKLNWQKLYDHNPMYTIMADKYLVKDYVKGIIGEQYVVPCYGVWKSFNEINFEELPNEFVLKSTHDSSGAIVCRDKKTFDINKARKHIQSSQERNWYPHLREWVYKDMKPQIIADKLLDDKTGNELRDYKIWCFNGEPKYIYITVKARSIYENFYDMNFEPVDINHGFERHTPEFDKPKAFEEMKELAAKLSSGIPFVRVDFFYVNGKIYFGEFTFYDWGGMRPFANFDCDKYLGDLMNLSTCK